MRYVSPSGRLVSPEAAFDDSPQARIWERVRDAVGGGRFWSAYLFDPFGIRLEFATDRSGIEQGVVESVLQTEAEARAELETLFSDPKEVQKWLRHMPLKNGDRPHF